MPRPPSFALPRPAVHTREDYRQEHYTSRQLNCMFDLAVKHGEASAIKYIEGATHTSSKKHSSSSSKTKKSKKKSKHSSKEGRR